ANPAEPVVIGNYSANPTLNADAAQVESLCRQIMNADGNGGGDVYYRDGRTYSAVTFGLGFPTLLGNPNLEQEDATTYTIGAVISSPVDSPWLSRLNLAVDYYNVDLTDAIAPTFARVDARRRAMTHPPDNQAAAPVGDGQQEHSHHRLPSCHLGRGRHCRRRPRGAAVRPVGATDF